MSGEVSKSSDSSSSEELPPMSPVELTPAEQAEVEESMQHNESLLTDLSFNDNTVTVSASYWNVQPASGEKAEIKRHLILEILSLINVDLYALQELPWVPQTFVEQINRVAEAPDKPYFERPHYRILGFSKEAVIYYNFNKFEASEIEFERDYLPVAADRVVVAKMTTRNTTPACSFYFASVHLPYTTGGSVPEKKATAKKLLTKLRDYAESENFPLFVAGDFNLQGLDDKKTPVAEDFCDVERVTTSFCISNRVDRHFWCGKCKVVTSDFSIFERSTEGYTNFSANASARLQAAELSVEAIENVYTLGGSHQPVKCTISLEI